MKDIVFAIIPFTSIVAVLTQEQVGFYEKLLEKWGIGLIGLGLFFALARWTARRETKLQEARDKKEAESLAERVGLLTENNRLQGELLKAINSHAQKAEQLTKEATKANSDHASALRMLLRKMKRPCVLEFDEKEFGIKE
jgi:hypothetical protein